MNLILVGAGGPGRQLLRRLGELWDVTVVDVDAGRLALAEGVREVTRVEGDGSSKVALGRAGLERADAVVAATDDDEVNLEVCRLALEAGVLRVAAVAADPGRRDRYRDLGVTAYSPDSLAARRLEVELEPRRISSSPFARGRAEAIEFEIAADSPVRGKALKDLHSQHYLVAAILRGGDLIVPHGNTVIEEGDLVTVVGSANDFSLIVRTFTAGESRFPVDFGKNVLVAIESQADVEGPLAEAIELTRNSRAAGLIVVHPDPESSEQSGGSPAQLLGAARGLIEGVEVLPRPVAGTPAGALEEVIRHESVGVVVVPPPPAGELLGRLRAVNALRRYWGFGVPVLMSRGTLASGPVVAPARDTPAGRAAARAAIDLARYLNQVLVGVAVVSPQFLAGGLSRDEARLAMLRLREEAAVLGVQVRRSVRQGNPVRVIEQAAGDAGLVVLGMPARSPTLSVLGTGGHLARKLASSVLWVPAPG